MLKRWTCMLPALFLLSTALGGQENDVIVNAKKTALQAHDGAAIVAASLEIAKADNDDAVNALLEVLDEPRVLSRLEDPIFADGAVNSIFEPSNYIEKLLFALPEAMPKRSEDFLLHQLDKEKNWGPFTNKVGGNFVRMRARLEAFGNLKNPSESVYDLLGGVAANRASSYQGDAQVALFHIGSVKAKDLLQKYVNEDPNLAMTAQHVRQKAPMFELLVESYHQFPDEGGQILGAILAKDYAVNLPPASNVKIPSYDSVDPAVAATFEKALDSLLQNPGKRALSNDEKKSIEALRDLFREKKK